MRELKFRLWAEDIKQMHYFDLLNLGEYDFIRKTEPVMQFTGLKDRNGNDIYEGDILLTDSGRNMYVSYREDMTMFVARFSEQSGSCGIESDWRIIGNIYENPNLLTKHL